MSIRRPAVLALAAALLLAPLAACGSSAQPQTSPSGVGGTYPVTVAGVTISKRPERIVSLSATSTEVLFAIGAGSQVVAVDKNSNYPADAPKGDLDSYQPNVEAIAAKKPDLIVVSRRIEGLAALGVPIIVDDAAVTLDDAYKQITEMGAATGHADGATGVVKKLQDGITKVVDSVKKTTPPLTYYYELDPTYFSATSKTFIGALLGKLGLENIADKAPGGAGDYPQLSAEFIVSASPDLVILADTKCCGQSAATVAARSGWSKVKAVTKTGVVALDDDVASRWGPRVVDLLDTVAQVATKAAAAR
jgi:iron complex transport system substrate-binding protein